MLAIFDYMDLEGETTNDSTRGLPCLDFPKLITRDA